MCGIAGLIHKGKSSNVGGEMTAMLQALKHRGPDSTGYAVYSKGAAPEDYIMRIKVAEAEDRAIGVEDHGGVEALPAAGVELVDGRDQDHAVLLRRLSQRRHGRTVARVLGHLAPHRFLGEREVGGGEELAQAQHPHAALGGCGDEVEVVRDVGGADVVEPVQRVETTLCCGQRRPQRRFQFVSSACHQPIVDTNTPASTTG